MTNVHAPKVTYPSKIKKEDDLFYYTSLICEIIDLIQNDLIFKLNPYYSKLVTLKDKWTVAAKGDALYV